jgi:hypothetical protein
MISNTAMLITGYGEEYSKDGDLIKYWIGKWGTILRPVLDKSDKN